MEVQIDGIFLIGKSHKVCEDYMIHGEKPLPHIIISDGCSSSKDTDVGSRLLGLAAKQTLLRFHKEGCLFTEDEELSTPERVAARRQAYIDFGVEAIQRARFSGATLGVDRTTIDATLMVAFIHKGKIFSYTYGDGYKYEVNQDYEIFTEYHFTNGAPFYLSYWIDRERKNGYIEQKLKEKNCLTIRQILGSQESVDSVPYDEVLYSTHPIDKVSLFMIASDGAEQVMNVQKQKMPPEAIMKKFAAFKQVTGKFLQRRVSAELRSLDKKGFHNHDDLAVGCFLVERENDEENSSSGEGTTDTE